MRRMSSRTAFHALMYFIAHESEKNLILSYQNLGDYNVYQFHRLFLSCCLAC
jgi:hypothetical protein